MITRILIALLISFSISKTASAQSKIYSFDRGLTGNLLSFSIDDPSALDFRTRNYRLAGLDFDANGILHGIDISSNSLGTVDRESGEFVPVDQFSGNAADVVGMSYSSQEDIFYVATGENLFLLDPSSGELEFVNQISGSLGKLPIGPLLDIAVDNDGLIYCCDETSNSLWRIEQTTGLATWLAFLPVQQTRFSSLDFEPASNQLFQFLADDQGNEAFGSWSNLDSSPVFSESRSLGSFPKNAQLRISLREISLQPGSRLFVMGDSWGNGSDEYPARLWNMGYDVRNNSIPGRALHQMQTTFRDDVRMAASDAVILEGGVNDIAQNRSFSQIQSAYLSMFADMPTGLPLIATTIGPIAEAGFMTPDRLEVLQSVNNWLRTLDVTNVFVLDIVPVLDTDGDGALDHSNDAVHPNGTGQFLLAAAIRDLLQSESLFSQAFAFNNHQTGSLATFPTNSGDAFSLLASNYQAIAMDFNDRSQELWAIDDVSETAGRIDLSNGEFSSAFSLSGDLDSLKDVVGLTYDAVEDSFFVSTESAIYSMNRLGLTTFVGAYQDSSGTPIHSMKDISANRNGEVYGFETLNDNLYFIDKTTGTCSIIGQYSLGDATGNQSIDFDPSSDLLYSVLNTESGIGSYGRWNLKTGVFLEITPLESFPGNDAIGYDLEIAIIDQFAVSFPPEQVSVFRGSQLGGTLASFATSDNDRAEFRPGFTISSIEAPVWLIFESGNAQSVQEFVLESNASTPGLEFTFEAFNWSDNSFDVLGIESESFNVDVVRQFPIDIMHLQDNGDVRARIGWRQVGFTLSFPWQIRVDQAGWHQE